MSSINHIRRLLLSDSDDAPSSAMLRALGMTGVAAVSLVDLAMPLVLSPDLVEFSSLFDGRLAPSYVDTDDDTIALFRRSYSACDSDSCAYTGLDGVYAAMSGWPARSAMPLLFSHTVGTHDSVLRRLGQAADCKDSPVAVGAVLLACAYRRMLSEEGV